MSPDAEFERCWPWLKGALDRSPLETHHKQHIKDRIGEDAVLWAGKRAAAVTEIVTHPSGLKVCHIWLAGGDLSELKIIEGQIEEFALLNDCRHMTITGRRGWLRALNGYREGPVAMTKELGQ